MYTHIHPLGRFSFAISLFAATILTQHAWVLICLLIILVGQIRLFTGVWRPLWHAFRLLLWLIIPIFLLHLVFTPGRVIWPGSGLPFSYEGVNQASWLALHLCALFAAAMGLSRSLSLSEWTYYVARMPLIGARLLPFVTLALPMQKMVGESIQHQHRKPHTLKEMPNTLAGLFADVWQGADVLADRIWECWQAPSYQRPNSGYALGVVMGVSGLFVLFISGQI